MQELRRKNRFVRERRTAGMTMQAGVPRQNTDRHNDSCYHSVNHIIDIC
jgi:hypothetical protein